MTNVVPPSQKLAEAVLAIKQIWDCLDGDGDRLIMVDQKAKLLMAMN